MGCSVAGTASDGRGGGAAVWLNPISACGCFGNTPESGSVFSLIGPGRGSESPRQEVGETREGLRDDGRMLT